MATPLDLLHALRMLPFARLGADRFAALAPPSAAFAERFPRLLAEDPPREVPSRDVPALELTTEFPFLTAFLADAEAFWRRGEAGALRSGPWTQPDAYGDPVALEASALTVGDDHEPFLLLELLGAEFAELREIHQHSREQRLAYEDLARLHAALAESTRRAERMAAERLATNALLQQAREQLEQRVAARTVELTAANERLAAESCERERVNTALLAHQQQLGQLAEQLAVAEESERREIAEFLHDRLGQNLALVKLRLRAHANGLPGAGDALTEVDGLMDEIISDTRALTADLGTPLLYEVGLVAALQSLVRRFEDTHGIASRFRDDDRDKPLGDQARGVVYRAVRELLHNIVKHADAQQVEVDLRRHGERVEVRVADRGAGFDTAGFEFRVTTDGGFGLFHIRERLRHLGGSCTVRSTPGHGTEVVLMLPLAPEDLASP